MLRTYRLPTALLVLAAVIVVAGNAQATTVRFSPAGSISLVSLGTIGSEHESVFVRCKLTMRGILNSSVELRAGNVLGQISSANEISECEGGEVTATLGLSWNLTYQRALGALPDNVTGIEFQIASIAFNVSTLGGLVNCLYRGTQRALLGLADTGTNTDRTLLVELVTTELPLIRGGAFCPSTSELEGRFTITAQTLTFS